MNDFRSFLGKLERKREGAVEKHGKETRRGERVSVEVMRARVRAARVPFWVFYTSDEI